jgi:hypothetical protein
MQSERRSSHVRLSAVVPAFSRTRHPFTVSALRPSQMIEFVFAASPETIRSEASGDWLSIAQSAIRRTWQPARCVILFSLAVGGLRRRSGMLFCRHKRPVLAIHCEQIRHHLSRYS